jgi:hypothetical protein
MTFLHEYSQELWDSFLIDLSLDQQVIIMGGNYSKEIDIDSYLNKRKELQEKASYLRRNLSQIQESLSRFS